MPGRLDSYRSLLMIGFCLLGPLSFAQERKGAVNAVSESELPYNQQPINYSAHEADDAVSRLRQRMRDGTVSINRIGERGALDGLLKVLDIPASSQLLVFSKSSANARYITPKTPRAIYFNDDVYVGWVPGSPMIEISAIDPHLGGVFYSLPQSSEVDSSTETVSPHSFRRDESCLLCHISRSTLRVPGHLVRSFTTDFEGRLQTGWSRITHSTPYSNRWAGWYVTGRSKGFQHLGNVFGSEIEKQSPTVELRDLSSYFDAQRYLASTSDIVAHLVLEHQAHGHNLITRLNYESRLGRPITASEPLLRYFLFLDAPALPEAVGGNTDYIKWFEERGPRDRLGRSLRQFDLKTRLFQFRMSYLIHSPAFDALPDTVRTEFFKNLKTWLTTTDANHPASQLPAEERQEILEILRDTKTGLPTGW